MYKKMIRIFSISLCLVSSLATAMEFGPQNFYTGPTEQRQPAAPARAPATMVPPAMAPQPPAPTTGAPLFFTPMLFPKTTYPTTTPTEKSQKPGALKQIGTTATEAVTEVATKIASELRKKREAIKAIGGVPEKSIPGMVSGRRDEGKEKRIIRRQFREKFVSRLNYMLNKDLRKEVKTPEIKAFIRFAPEMTTPDILPTTIEQTYKEANSLLKKMRQMSRKKMSTESRDRLKEKLSRLKKNLSDSKSFLEKLFHIFRETKLSLNSDPNVKPIDTKEKVIQEKKRFENKIRIKINKAGPMIDGLTQVESALRTYSPTGPLPTDPREKKAAIQARLNNIKRKILEVKPVISRGLFRKKRPITESLQLSIDELSKIIREDIARLTGQARSDRSTLREVEQTKNQATQRRNYLQSLLRISQWLDSFTEASDTEELLNYYYELKTSKISEIDRLLSRPLRYHLDIAKALKEKLTNLPEELSIRLFYILAAQKIKDVIEADVSEEMEEAEEEAVGETEEEEESEEEERPLEKLLRENGILYLWQQAMTDHIREMSERRKAAADLAAATIHRNNRFANLVRAIAKLITDFTRADPEVEEERKNELEFILDIAKTILYERRYHPDIAAITQNIQYIYNRGVDVLRVAGEAAEEESEESSEEEEATEGEDPHAGLEFI